LVNGFISQTKYGLAIQLFKRINSDYKTGCAQSITQTCVGTGGKYRVAIKEAKAFGYG
jgi:hypothetical protein